MNLDSHSPDEFDPVRPPSCHCGARLEVRCATRRCNGETCDDCPRCARCEMVAQADAVESFLRFAGGLL